MGIGEKICFVIDVYSKCNLVAKQRLWETLVEERFSRG